MKRLRLSAGKGAIMLIAGLMVSSGAIRLGVGAGQAVATENAFAADDQAMDAVKTSRSNELTSQEIAPMLTAFQQREDRIAERERQLEVRLKALAVADEEIEKRLVLLKQAEDSLRATLAIADTAAEDDLARLTTVYENMKPKDAAILFEEMEPAFAAGFLGRMRPDSAAGIMAGLSPKAAYSISVILAGRNASVPKN